MGEWNNFQVKHNLVLICSPNTKSLHEFGTPFSNGTCKCIQRQLIKITIYFVRNILSKTVTMNMASVRNLVAVRVFDKCNVDTQ